LIYTLMIELSPQRPRREVNLIFFDASGEDQSSEERLESVSHYVFNANGIIFLIDPGRIPKFAQALPAHLQSSAALGQRTSNVLNLVVDRLESHHSKREAGVNFAKIPMAITLAKSDLLSLVPDKQKYTFWQKKPHDGIIDWADLDKVNQEVQQFLSDYEENQLLRVASSIPEKKRRFFAISATGNAPDQGRYTNVDPIRCLDPVMWILYELGILRTV